ncbi:lipocalin family protein [Chryseobacterium sp.]|uniref:lipocalin family protein n=1 Tax=unclassified Chryseobacterium TaxID=2593645 RepID=UPI00289E02DB|nr:lipocalin family protein [Chryseobacterium sp.]
MKKQLLLFAFSALALTSCKDENLEAYDMEIMQGDWKEVKRELISGKDKTVLQTDIPTGCEAKNTLYLKTDYYVSYTAYTGTGTDCQMDVKTEGRYTYDAGTKVIGIKLGDEGSMDFKIEVLTSKDLKMVQQSGLMDMNGDKVPDYTYITYKR